MALSVDGENDPVVPAIIAASLAVSTSNIPWSGPVGAVRVAKNGGSFIVNPVYKERSEATLDFIVCGREGKINMIEGEAKEMPEAEVSRAFDFAKNEIEKIQKFQEEIIKEIGR